MSLTRGMTKTTVITTIERMDADGRIHKETKTEEKITYNDAPSTKDTYTPLSPSSLKHKHDHEFGGDIVDKTQGLTLSPQSHGPKPTSAEFCDQMLRLHNEYRKKHGVPNLSLSSKLNAFAQEWAEHLAKSGQFEHRKNNSYGENIFFGQRSGGMSAKDAAELWYSEIKNYNFSGYANSSCGHFTQMVWKESRQLGIGWVQNSDGTTYVVANYDPPGNVIGRYKENVLQPL